MENIKSSLQERIFVPKIEKLKIKDGIDNSIKIPDKSFINKIRFIDFKRMKIFAEELQGNLIGSSLKIHSLN